MPDAQQEIIWAGATLGARAYLWYARRVRGHPLKLRLARCIGRRFFSKGLPLASPSGAKICIQMTIPDYIPHALVFSGNWEPKSIALSQRLMAPGGIFVDIGAHIGLYTCAVGTLPNVESIAIEPSAELFCQLAHNVSLNPGLDATLVNGALGQHWNMVRIGTTSRHNTGTRRVLFDVDEAENVVMVLQSSLDDTLKRLGIERRIRLIKIDIEGYELDVIKGINWAAPYRPHHIIAEIDDGLLKRAGTSADEFVNFLSSKGYKPLTVEGRPIDIRDHANFPEQNLWFKANDSKMD